MQVNLKFIGAAALAARRTMFQVELETPAVDGGYELLVERVGDTMPSGFPFFLMNKGEVLTRDSSISPDATITVVAMVLGG